MNFDETINNFLEVLEVKTSEGVTKLLNTCIGTKEYEMLVQHIVSNINLIKETGAPQQNPNDLTKIIGEDFE